MAAPFTDQGEAAVCARVAIALVKRARRQMLPDEPQPAILVGIAVSQIKGLQLVTVRLALLSLSVWLVQKRRSQDWLSGVIMRDYYGFSIRRCYYAEYKGTRRSDPRVTNRGVTSLPPLSSPDNDETSSEAFGETQ